MNTLLLISAQKKMGSDIATGMEQDGIARDDSAKTSGMAIQVEAAIVKNRNVV